MEYKQNTFATKECTTDSKDIDTLKASQKVRSTKWRHISIKLRHHNEHWNRDIWYIHDWRV